MDHPPEADTESLQIRDDMEKILETILYIKTEAYSQWGNIKDLLIRITSDEFDFLKSYMDTATVLKRITETVQKAISRLEETLELISKVEDVIEEMKSLYRHIFHIKCHSVLFEVFYILSPLIDPPHKNAFEFLASFIKQMVALKNYSRDMKRDLQCVTFDFETLNDIFSLIEKGAKHENLFALAEQELHRFFDRYVEKQLYWHMKFYWDMFCDWMDDLQWEIAHLGAYQGIDASDGLHPVKIQDMLMRALGELSIMRANYSGLREMLMEIIKDKGTGAGKFLQGFKDDKEKELVLYAIAVSIPEDYSKELWGILKYFKEIKMYKQIRNCRSIAQYKELLGDIYPGTIEARNFIRSMKQLH